MFPSHDRVAAFDVQSPVRDTNTLSQTDLQTEVDVLVGFTVRGVVNVAQYQQTFTNTYMIKGAQFQTKQLGELTTPVATNSFYLCKQTRRSDLEVVDSFFLIPPVTTTFDTGIDFISPGEFLPGPVASAAQGLVSNNLVPEGVVLPEDNRAALPTQAERFQQQASNIEFQQPTED